ncbi:RDD domain containing protein [Vibrio phage SHOU24]|uniref:RDD domain containing protein n=1 Tax=Vibrio phage SHOU24 TaxID=1414739 RepID=UPI0003ED1E56|nr:RDD domain containing protein [Vibrio phage SHOU24]AHI61247.1 RDD domain containing protein [Vibrio phage SHOU24]
MKVKLMAACNHAAVIYLLLPFMISCASALLCVFVSEKLPYIDMIEAILVVAVIRFSKLELEIRKLLETNED